MRELTVNKNDSGIRIDKFMSRCFPTMPKSLLYKYIRLKCVKVNGKKVGEDAIINEGDKLTFYISDEFFGKREKEAFLDVTPNLNVVYEDSNILIVSKPSGLVVHSGANEDFNTLINRIKAYLYKKGEYNPANENSFAPALCNRIDRNTEGLVVAAKNAEALREMNEIIKERELEKKYLCVVRGIPTHKEAELTDYLSKISEENRVVLSKKKLPGSKIAILKYKVVDTNKAKNLALLEVELITGRTHQIRVQLASAGFPLLGDGKYSENRYDRKMGYGTQALCSYSLAFKLNNTYTLLGYLNGKTFTAVKPDFLELFLS
ncbi:MAG: RluA family pseudouridine synthase [Eubacteriales bacterium]|nr:RluA family pseudouridine synthase [Eubacteriales bacterium]MDD4476077.1 RluA family pseudouridine synthase [Eubacteriales bacterium]